MIRVNRPLSAALALLLAGCAAPPLGPTVAVMPSPTKPFDVFAQDDAMCRQYASQQTAGMAAQANGQALGSAALGTLLGAGLGAAVGGGRGAAIGAGSGAIVGTGIGAQGSGFAQMGIQQRYDVAYSQCMYSRGNQVPGIRPAYAPGPPPYAPGPPPYAPPPYPYPPQAGYPQ